MNVFLLMQALRGYLKPRLATLPLAVHSRGREIRRLPEEDSKTETMRPCSVFIGSMPPTTQDALSAAPFLVIQPMDGEYLEDFSETARIVFRLCVVAGEYGKDELEAAENDLFNLLSQLRLWLLELPGGCICGNRWRMLEEFPKMAWERPDQQAPPFLQAHFFTRWQTRGARRAPSPNMDDYE